MHSEWNLLVWAWPVAFLTFFAHGGEDIPDYDFDWVVICDPGNRGFEGGPVGQLAGRGSLDYIYRFSQTEVTVSQWFEFVQAYAPYAGDKADDKAFTGFFISIVGPPGNPSSYQIVPGFENYPTDMSWRIAARYVNWLHNGKENTSEAFETGVFDTSTFTVNGDGTYNDQVTHSPDATFWIPTLDEWIKGVYYDPDANGGEGGWWHHPDSSDTPLIVGPPGKGETNASAWAGAVPAFPLGVGFYPEIQSPWGLLDGSGGMREWTEEIANSLHSQRKTKGSSFFSDDFSYQWEDGILTSQSAFVWTAGLRGLRVASAVPGSTCLADLDGDTVVGILDFLDLLAAWGTPGPGDIDCDGTVGIVDFLAMLSVWGSCP